MIEQRMIDRVATEVAARPEQVAAAIQFFDKGATVPFVARYRKDATQNLDEERLEKIESRNLYYTALTNRRNAILENVEKQGALNDALRAQIDAALDQTTLEDLYLPFKKQRRTRATAALDAGLRPLAEYLWSQQSDGRALEAAAAEFVAPEKKIASAAEALAGAKDILAEWVAVDAGVRKLVRDEMLDFGVLQSYATKNSEDQKTKFESYYNYTEPLKKAPSHRLLAVLRGVRMGLLRMELKIDDDTAIEDIGKKLLQHDGAFKEALQEVIADAYKRLLRPSIENEVVAIVRERAEEEAIRVFRENARNLLLSPPAGALNALGVDPGLRTGCKLAVVDKFGTYVANDVVFIADGQEAKHAAAEETLTKLIEAHGIQAIAIGNGTGSREAGRFFRRLLGKLEKPEVFTVFVNESGASIYSASKTAREEFPDLDVTVRGAVSIARRLQDPLAELVKIEPKSIGVGQYQHDLNQRNLREGLYKTVESCVNLVGVDLNSASVELLRYVSGIQMGTAQNLVQFRVEHGGIKSRAQLLEVSGIGERTFEQAAGFLRIPNAEHPLDRTAIHPEVYPLVEQIAARAGKSVADLLEDKALLNDMDLSPFEAEAAGKHVLEDIRQELLKPGRDPRSSFEAPQFIEGVESIDQLEEGSEVEGVVTNVTDFGAFVDIGVHQDGLIHLSELANRFVRDPRQIVHVGQIVRVKVVRVDKEMQRISLSMKALQAAPQKAQGGRRGAPPADGAGNERQRPKKAAKRTGGSDDKRRGGRKKPEGAGRGTAKKQPSEPTFGTGLADQLESLRDKFGS